MSFRSLRTTDYNYFQQSAKYIAYERDSMIMINLSTLQALILQSCDNSRVGRTRYCKYPPQIIFRRKHFPNLSRVCEHARAARDKNPATFAAHFLHIRSELRRGHYGNNRSRISPAINSGSVYKPRIYDRKRCWCNISQLLHRCCCCCCCCCYCCCCCCCGVTFRERSREPY